MHMYMLGIAQLVNSNSKFWFGLSFTYPFLFSSLISFSCTCYQLNFVILSRIILPFCVFKNNCHAKKQKHIKKTLCIHCYFLQDFREMVCCQLNQQYSFSVNNFYELNLHQFHKDQQLLANHLMISTFAILNNNRSCVSIPIIT